MKKLVQFLVLWSCCHSVSAQLVRVNGGTLYVDASAQIKINGGLTITTGSTVQNDGTLTVTGDFQNSGTLTATGILELSGTANQQFDAGGSTISALDVNKGGGVVNLTSSLTISGSLDITGSNNKVQLNNNNVTIDVGAVITGGNNTSYFITNGTGSLIQNSIGSSNRLYPIGTSTTSYNPARVRNFGTNDDYSVRVEVGQSSAYTAGVASGSPIATTQEVNRVWIVNEGTPGASNTTLVLQWDAAHEDASFNRNASAVHWYSYTTGWGRANSFSAAGVAGSSFTQTLTGIPSCNRTPYGVASAGTDLPVEWLCFEAQVRPMLHQVNLNWSTSAEKDNERFDIERSVDNVHFTGIGSVKGSGTTLQTQHYNYQDNVQEFTQKEISHIYYRLKQVDFNGQFEYSSVEAVELDKPANRFSIYPNPSCGKITINAPSGSCVQVISPRGEVIAEEVFAEDFLQMSVDRKGFVFIRCISPKGVVDVKKLVLQ